MILDVKTLVRGLGINLYVDRKEVVLFFEGKMQLTLASIYIEHLDSTSGQVRLDTLRGIFTAREE